MSRSDFSSNMQSELPFKNTEVDGDTREDFGKLIKEVNERQNLNSTDECMIVDSRCIKDHSSNVINGTDSSADGSEHHCGSKTARIQGRKRKLKSYHKVTDKRTRVDERNARREQGQRRRRLEKSNIDSNQDESQISMFSPDTSLDAERDWSCKTTAMDSINTACLGSKKPCPTLMSFQSQLMTSESKSQSSFPIPNFLSKKVIIEVPDPLDKGKYIKVRGEAQKIKFLKYCDLSPYVNLGEKFLHTKEIQKCLYKGMFMRKFNKVKDKKNVKNGKYVKVKSEARKIRFSKYCDLNPCVNLGERVPHTKEEIRVFLYKNMLMKKLNEVKGKKTVKMEKGKYINVTGEARKIKFLKNCDLNPYVNLGKRVPHTTEENRVFLYKDMLMKKGNEVKNKKSAKNSEMKPKLCPFQKTPKTVDLEKFSTESLFLSQDISNMVVLPKSRNGTMKKRVAYQEKVENLKYSERNFDLELSLNDPDHPSSRGDSKTLAELRESERQNMKNESEKCIKSKLPDIHLKVGARKNFNQPLKPKMPASQPRLFSNPGQKVTNTPAKGNCIDKTIKEHELFCAANTGDYHQIAKLLSLGVSVETETLKQKISFPLEHNITPLQIAAKNGHVKCIEILIHHGANVDARNKLGCTALHLAAKNGNYLCLKMLLEAGADCRALISRHFYISQCFDGRGTTALHLAVTQNNEKCAKKLIKFGANCNAVDEKGNTPLHLAVKCKALSCVKELLHAGSDVNCINNAGLSPLHFLCMHPQLYEKGADETKMKILKYLVLKGYNTNINKTTSSGLTALNLAFQSRSFPVIKFLISCDAEVNLKENSVLEFLVSELIELEFDLNNMKYLTTYVLQLPRLKSLNIQFRRIECPENFIDKDALHCDLVLPDNLKFQFFHTETEIYVETYNYQFIILPGDVQYILQQPFLNLVYDCVIAELKYRDGYFHNDIWNCFSHFSTYQLLLLKKLLWYEQIASSPRTLQHYCRYYIRKYMGPTNLKHIRKLPLSKKLRSYLLFKCDE